MVFAVFSNNIVVRLDATPGTKRVCLSSSHGGMISNLSGPDYVRALDALHSGDETAIRAIFAACGEQVDDGISYPAAEQFGAHLTLLAVAKAM